MEPETLFYIALFVYWIASQIFAIAKKAKQGSFSAPPETHLPPEPPPPSRPHAAPEALNVELGAARREALELRDTLDPSLRTQVSFVLERELEPAAVELRARLEAAAASPPHSMGDAAEASELTARYRGLSQAARSHQALRGRRELEGPRAVADALVSGFARSPSLALASPPAVALLWEPTRGHALLSSELTPFTVFVPPGVANDPTAWHRIAADLSRYLGAVAPGLDREIYEELDLAVSETEVANDPSALAKLLFIAWMDTVLTDMVGTSLLGPAYVRALAARLEAAESPGSVVGVQLQPDGTIATRAAPHARIHWACAWLEQSGLGEEAMEIRNGWDARHQQPEAFGVIGTPSALPAQPILATHRALMATLHSQRFEGLGHVRLIELPGLEDIALLHEAATRARFALTSGQPAEQPPRALVAAALAAALETPEIAPQLNESLWRALSPAMRTTGSRMPRKARSASRSARLRIGPREVAEALLLQDVLLEPRSR